MIVPHHSLPVPILMVNNGKCEAEVNTSDIGQINDQDLTPLVKPTCNEPRCITAARQVVLKAICETSVLVSTQALGLLQVATRKNVDKTPVCTTARGIMGVYPRRLIYITISNFGKVDVHLQKHQTVGEVTNAPVRMGHIDKERFL